MTSQKIEKLQEYLDTLKSGVVALSGGVDSSVLAVLASKTAGFKLAAVTVISPAHPASETEVANELCRVYQIPHTFLKLNQLENEFVRRNDSKRCYYCKKLIYTAILEQAENLGLEHVLDGSNMDDLQTNDRPGFEAVSELDIKTPLIKSRLTKTEIRQIALDLKLPMWDSPATACYFTRIPVGEPLTMNRITRIAQAEQFIRTLGISSLRVRDHGRIARIEVDPETIELVASPAFRDKVVTYLKSLGYRFVCLDLAGYKMGSMNLKG